eukprot:gene13008-9305_t
MPAGTGAQKRIRDLQRLIKKAGDDQERIAALQQKIEEVSNEKATRVDPDMKKKHEEKYHLVKFVERKKLTRMIQRVMKQVESETDDANKQPLQTKLDSLKDDLCYVMYYPVDMKYVALFARKERQNQEGSTDEARAQMDPKEAALSARARQAAHHARARDVAVGRDRVQFAIDVHLYGGKKAAEMMPPAKKAKVDTAVVPPPAPSAPAADGFFLEEVADAPPLNVMDDSNGGHSRHGNRYSRPHQNNYHNNTDRAAYQHVKGVVNRKKFRTHKNLKVRGEKKFA